MGHEWRSCPAGVESGWTCFRPSGHPKTWIIRHPVVFEPSLFQPFVFELFRNPVPTSLGSRGTNRLSLPVQMPPRNSRVRFHGPTARCDRVLGMLMLLSIVVGVMVIAERSVGPLGAGGVTETSIHPDPGVVIFPSPERIDPNNGDRIPGLGNPAMTRWSISTKLPASGFTGVRHFRGCKDLLGDASPPSWPMTRHGIHRLSCCSPPSSTDGARNSSASRFSVPVPEHEPVDIAPHRSHRTDRGPLA